MLDGTYIIDLLGVPDAPSAAIDRTTLPFTVLLNQLALPDDAVALEITVQDKDGLLRMQMHQLWADKSFNANTPLLANEISDQSKAMAIVEPWPLSDPAGRRLEVRIVAIYADTVRRFKLAVALADGSFGGLIAAQTQALRDLARDISQLK